MNRFQVLPLLVMLVCCCFSSSASKQQHGLQLKYKVVCLPQRSKNDYCCVYHRCASVFMNLYQLLSLSAARPKKAASAVTAFMTSQLKVLECPLHRAAAIGLCWPHWWHALLDWYPLLLGMLSLALWEAFGWSARNFCTRQNYGLRRFVF